MAVGTVGSPIASSSNSTTSASDSSGSRHVNVPAIVVPVLAVFLLFWAASAFYAYRNRRKAAKAKAVELENADLEGAYYLESRPVPSVPPPAYFPSSPSIKLPPAPEYSPSVTEVHPSPPLPANTER
ncbi:hypothetical protein MNV49_003164 [Pseudohyphozyma bogoriensis]|nr:hypothetical protein MNV49_003164 [Pseudohyphozyma bogoriensis]